MDADRLIEFLQGPDGGRVAAAIADALARRCQAPGVARSQSRGWQSREDIERAASRQNSLENANSRGELAASLGRPVTDNPFCEVDHRNAWIDGYEGARPKTQVSE